MPFPSACVAARMSGAGAVAAWLDLSWSQAEEVAADMRCPEEVLGRLVEHGQVSVRYALTANPALPTGLLLRLTKDRSARVRRAATQALERCQELGGVNVIEGIQGAAGPDSQVAALKMVVARRDVTLPAGLVAAMLRTLADSGNVKKLLKAARITGAELDVDHLLVLEQLGGWQPRRSMRSPWSQAVAELCDGWLGGLRWSQTREELRRGMAGEVRDVLAALPIGPPKQSGTSWVAWSASQATTSERELARLVAAPAWHTGWHSDLLAMLLYTHPNATARTAAKVAEHLDDAYLIALSPQYGSAEYVQAMVAHAGVRPVIVMLSDPRIDWKQLVGEDRLVEILSLCVHGWELLDMDETYMRALQRPELCTGEMLKEIARIDGEMAGVFVATHPQATQEVLSLATYCAWEHADATDELLARLAPESAGQVAWQFAKAVLDESRSQAARTCEQRVYEALNELLARTCESHPSAWQVLEGLAGNFTGSVEELCELVRDTVHSPRQQDPRP